MTIVLPWLASSIPPFWRHRRQKIDRNALIEKFQKLRLSFRYIFAIIPNNT